MLKIMEISKEPLLFKAKDTLVELSLKKGVDGRLMPKLTEIEEGGKTCKMPLINSECKRHWQFEMWKWIKRLLCNHDWYIRGNSSKICKKCNKYESNGT